MLNQAAHPLAGAGMTGAEMVVQVLADEGVNTIFGYSGGAILPIYDAVFRYNAEHASAMPLIVPANEQGAGFMAAGFARASGKVGVAMVTSGPGATNMVTPVRDCMADSVPIVVICGQVATTSIGTDAFQEAPVPSIMGAVAKHVFLVTDPAKLEATVRTAFEIARTGRPGPVVLDIPERRPELEGRVPRLRPTAVPGYRQRMNRLGASKLPEAACADFFAALGKSKRPLIYAGGGVINGNAAFALREFSETFQIPVVTTLMGIGAVDTTDPCRCACSACTAPRSPTTRSMTAIACSRSARVSTTGSPAIRPVCGRREVHRAFRHRRLGDQQGQARRLEPRRPVPDALLTLLDYGKAQGLQARLVRSGTGIARSCARPTR
jgi:acetolactate synthase I/II/III large subunit